MVGALLALALALSGGATASPPTRQLIVVSAARYGDTDATLSAYDTDSGVRKRVLGPWTARVGYNGFAPPGEKREGDGRTPSGTYGFGFMFGVDANPSVRYEYRRARPWDVWDDDPASPRYNEWVDTFNANPGLDPEPMDQIPAYDYGAVIDYNSARTPGFGSAIFLHANVGGPTAGCVSLPRDELVRVLRWLSPQRAPRIQMGVSQ